MQRYYDEMSIDCQGCYFLRDGRFTDGRPYKCCRYYGYILHESKGVSDEHCSRRMTRDDIIETQTKFTDYWMFGKNATPPFITTTNDV